MTIKGWGGNHFIEYGEDDTTGEGYLTIFLWGDALNGLVVAQAYALYKI